MDIEIKTSEEFEQVFKKYPPIARKKLIYIRELVLEVANKTKGITQLEETLKWGEPSFVTKNGSTLRMDWKSKSPNQYAIYFKCTSKLVLTFKEVFQDKFCYEGKRALVFKMDDKLPLKELKLCIQTALTYHKVKHLPTLGI